MKCIVSVGESHNEKCEINEKSELSKEKSEFQNDNEKFVRMRRKSKFQ